MPKLKKKENWETICVLCQNKRKDKDLGRNVSICWKGIDEEGEVDYIEQMENSNIRVNIFFQIKEEEHYIGIFSFCYKGFIIGTTQQALISY